MHRGVTSSPQPRGDPLRPSCNRPRATLIIVVSGIAPEPTPPPCLDRVLRPKPSSSCFLCRPILEELPLDPILLDSSEPCRSSSDGSTRRSCRRACFLFSCSAFSPCLSFPNSLAPLSLYCSSRIPMTSLWMDAARARPSLQARASRVSLATRRHLRLFSRPWRRLQLRQAAVVALLAVEQRSLLARVDRGHSTRGP